MWEVIDTGTRSAEENMQLDAELLKRAGERKRPLLHFYDWAGPSATYGYFERPGDLLDLKGVRAERLDLARRPTGGGMVFHLWDLAFSAVVPSTSLQFSTNTLENYALINEGVRCAVRAFLGRSAEPALTPTDAQAADATCAHFCMAKPTKYDVVWRGQKIAGAAQRKTKLGFLHQGTIALAMPDFAWLERVLLPHTEVLSAMRRHTFALLGNETSAAVIAGAKKELMQLLATHLR